MKRLKSVFVWSKKREKNYVKINLIFIFIFLNIWDFAVNRVFFNGMVLGILMFGPAAFLWLIGTFRAIALIILISFFEFMVMLIFIGEGLELGGVGLKGVFWGGDLGGRGLNRLWGVKV